MNENYNTENENDLPSEHDNSQQPLNNNTKSSKKKRNTKISLLNNRSRKTTWYQIWLKRMDKTYIKANKLQVNSVKYKEYIEQEKQKILSNPELLKVIFIFFFLVLSFSWFYQFFLAF